MSVNEQTSGITVLIAIKAGESVYFMLGAAAAACKHGFASQPSAAVCLKVANNNNKTWHELSHKHTSSPSEALGDERRSGEVCGGSKCI
jgi:hypothetical protein